MATCFSGTWAMERESLHASWLQSPEVSERSPVQRRVLTGIHPCLAVHLLVGRGAEHCGMLEDHWPIETKMFFKFERYY